MTSSGGYHARKSNAADGEKTSELLREFTTQDTRVCPSNRPVLRLRDASRRYAQDERRKTTTTVRPEPFGKLRTGFAERQRSEVEGRHATFSDRLLAVARGGSGTSTSCDSNPSRAPFRYARASSSPAITLSNAGTSIRTRLKVRCGLPRRTRLHLRSTALHHRQLWQKRIQLHHPRPRPELPRPPADPPISPSP